MTRLSLTSRLQLRKRQSLDIPGAYPAAGGGAFSQTAAILGAGGLDYALFDGGLSSSLFQEAAGTTPSVLTNPVGRWNARAKTPHYASQATAGQRPTLEAAGPKFDGSDDNLPSDWFAQEGANCIIVQASVPASISATQFVAGANSTGDANPIRIGFTTGGLLRVAYGSQVALDGGPDLRNQQAIVALSVDAGGNLVGFANGAQTAAAVATGAATTLRALMIGARNNDGASGSFFSGHAKRIAFGKTALTLAQFQSIRAEWLAAS